MADDGMIQVELCAPERATIELKVSEITLPGADGVFTVLPQHTSFLTTLIPGVVEAYEQGSSEPRFFAVSTGFAEVRDDCVRVLADAFEMGKEIDVARAEEARDRAEARLEKPDASTDVARAELALARSLARLNAQQRKGY